MMSALMSVVRKPSITYANSTSPKHVNVLLMSLLSLHNYKKLSRQLVDKKCVLMKGEVYLAIWVELPNTSHAVVALKVELQ